MVERNIAVIMTVHNRCNITIHGLRKLFESFDNAGDNYSFDVYMTDDGCTDGTREAVNNEFPSVQIVEGDGDLFWNRGMIKAWKAAASRKDYDYYLWFNDDVVLYKDSIRRLLDSSKAHEDQSLIVGSMCDPNDKTIITYSGQDNSIQRFDTCVEERECYATNGNLLLIPRVIYNTIGTNDPIFHHGEGDLDYGLRARKAGFKNYVAPGVFGECARHDGLPKWCNPQYALPTRLRSFFSSFSIMRRKDSFKFQLRHRGFIIAFFIQVKDYIKLVFPHLTKTS